MSLLELSPLERRNNQTQELKDELKNIGFLYKKKIIQNRELRNIYKCMCKTVWIEHRKGIEKINDRYGFTSYGIALLKCSTRSHLRADQIREVAL